jgi:hypothetical protein
MERAKLNGEIEVVLDREHVTRSNPAAGTLHLFWLPCSRRCATYTG